MAVFKKVMKKHIFLHPADKKRQDAAIKSTLLQNKKKYSDKLEGALLDVSNLKIIGDRHLIVDGYLSMDVVADFHVFCPKLGQTLEGVINKQSQSHLGCLVLDTFNAALSVPTFPKFEVSPQVGDSCTFVVTEVVVDGDMLFLRGTLASVTPNQTSTESFDKIEVKSYESPDKTQVRGQESPDKKGENALILAEDKSDSERPPDESFDAETNKTEHRSSKKKHKDSPAKSKRRKRS